MGWVGLGWVENGPCHDLAYFHEFSINFTLNQVLIFQIQVNVVSSSYLLETPSPIIHLLVLEHSFCNSTICLLGVLLLLQIMYECVYVTTACKGVGDYILQMLHRETMRFESCRVPEMKLFLFRRQFD